MKSEFNSPDNVNDPPLIARRSMEWIGEPPEDRFECRLLRGAQALIVVCVSTVQEMAYVL
ncbi:MAG: hypothetical protein HKN72_17375 [Gemmatimonadetes bacterium]|nr:hypothetical protein [Gemmatimonadota bacterium]